MFHAALVWVQLHTIATAVPKPKAGSPCCLTQATLLTFFCCRPPSSGSSSTQQGLAIPRHPTGSPCCLAQGPSLISPADAGSLCSLGRWESADDFEGQAHGAFKIDSRCSSDPDILAWLQDSLTT
eukprot:scaffold71872_cov14-Tisochrysis_lutea.AAC.3